MPHVQIYYDTRKIRLAEHWHRKLLNGIKEIVCTEGARLLSVDENQLNGSNFSFTFHASDPRFDELRHTIMVAIPAHNYPERSEQDGDPIARHLRVAIEQLIQRLGDRSLVGVTVSVSLHLFTYGYSSSTDDD